MVRMAKEILVMLNPLDADRMPLVRDVTPPTKSARFLKIDQPFVLFLL